MKSPIPKSSPRLSTLPPVRNRLFVVLIGCLALGSANLRAQLAITSHTIDGGGGQSSGGSFSVVGTIGQPDASAPLAAGLFGLTGGFWPDAGLTAPAGYPLWAAQNIEPGADAAFHGDADGDGIANGLLYALGPATIDAIDAGLLTAPQAIVPSDVHLVLYFTDDLLNWSVALEYTDGVRGLTHPDFSIIGDTVIHDSTAPLTFYRYAVGLAQ